MPDGAVLIAENAHTAVQAMVYAEGGVDFWGTQYHPESSPQDIAVYVRARGIFEHLVGLAEDLEDAEQDEEAAHRLGATPMCLALETRTRELANWLTQVEARSAA